MKTVEELAELNGFMPETDDFSDNRARLLYLCDVLRTLTDPGNGLTIDEIRKLLSMKGQEVNPEYKVPSKNTINEDLRALANHPHLGTTVHVPAQGKNEGFWFENLSLGRAQICLLINIVQACRFINQRQCNQLVEALKQLVPLASQDDIANTVFVDSRVKAASVDVFGALRVIARALNEKKQIQFHYTRYGLDGKKHFVESCAEGTFLYETPIALIFSNDNYYVETWTEYCAEIGAPLRRRLDRMEDVSISSKKAHFNQAIKDARKRSAVEERTRMSVDMLGSGRPCHLFLRVDEAVAANIILNKFGYDCILTEKRVPHTNDDLNGIGASGVAFITVQLSPTFYRLLCGMGNMVQIVKPKYIWSDQSKWTKRKRPDVPYEQLLEEYERAVAGYTEHLSSALAQYK